MKKHILLAIAFIMIALVANAQTPALFKYQSVVRDAVGNIIADQNVSFEIKILSGSANGNTVYTEEHHINTSTSGLANLTIGNGSILNGNIADIDWGAQLYFLQISIDLNGGTNFSLVGASQLLSVPYALHAKTVEQDEVNDADSDNTNEIQDLSLTGNTLTITNNANATNIDLSSFRGNNTDEQTLSLDGNTLTITNGNNVDLSTIKDGFEANTDNQSLSIAGTDLSITGGNSIDLAVLKDGVNDADADPNNEIQDLFLNGNRLKITNNDNATEIDLTNLQDGFQANTDDQKIDVLSLIGTELLVSLEDDGELNKSVDLSSLKDGFEANTDAQDLTLTGNVLSLSNDDTNVDLSNYLDNTDGQSLSLTGSNLSISGGNNVDLSSLQDGVNDADADATNEIQDLSLTGSTLKITNNGNATEINLAPFQGNNTDEQTLSLTNNTLAITNGNNVDLSGYLDNTDTQLTEAQVDAFVANDNYLKSFTEVDGSITNELQDISLVGNTLTLSDDATTVDLSGYLDNTDTQLTEAQVDAFVANDNYLKSFTEVDGSITNEIQDISLVGNTLTLSDDATTVDLSAYLDNTDTQLTEAQVDAFVANDNYLKSFTEVDGSITNEIQDLNLTGSTLKITNNANATEIDLAPFAGSNTDEQTLSLTGTNLSVSNGNSVDLASIQDGFEANTDAQNLSLSGNNLSLTNDATSVDLSGYLDNTDAQTLSFNGTSISIAGGNSVNISAINSLTLPVQTVSSNTTIDNTSQLIRITAQVEVTLPQTPTAGQILHVLGGNAGSTINPNGRNFRDGTNFLGSVTLSFTDMVGGQGAVALIFDGFNWNIVSKSGGAAAASQSLSLTGTNLSISDGNTVDLNSLKDGVGTDDQMIDVFSLSGSTLSLSLENDGEGNKTVDLSALQDGVNDADADATNEIQDLNLTGSTLKITNNANATEIDLSPFAGTNTDEQTLSLTGTNLSVSNGNSVDLASIQDGFEANTDAQTLSLTGTNLSVSGGNAVDLSVVQDGFEANTDNQGVDVFSLSGTTLSLSLDNDGEVNQTVDLSSLASSNMPITTIVSPSTLDTRNQIVRILPAGITVTLPAVPVTGQFIYVLPNSSDAAINANGKNIIGDGITFSNTNTFDTMVGGLGTIGIFYDGSSWRLFSKPGKKLNLSGNTLSLTNDAATVDLSNYLDNQTIDVLSLSGSTLSISLDGDGQANQTVDLSSLSGGGTFTTASNLTSNTGGTLATDDFLFGSFRLADGFDTDYDNRFFFDKSKGAFRAGGVAGTEWNDENVGQFSNATGWGNISSGDYSTAIGQYVTAQPYNSIVLGRYNVVAGTKDSWVDTDALFVLGNGTGSHSSNRSNALTILKNGNMGIGVTDPDSELEIEGQIKITGGSPGADKVLVSDANGLASWTFRRRVFETNSNVTSNSEGTYGLDDFVFGAPQFADDDDPNHSKRFFFDKSKGAFRAGSVSNDSWDDVNIGLNSVAFGYHTIASGTSSMAMGHENTASANYSTALGNETTANQSYATAMGYQSTASGQYATAMGRQTTASALYATSMGNNTQASGSSSTAFGNFTVANATQSTAMGNATTASNTAATAMGSNSTASGNTSTAMGQGTTASGTASTSMGGSTVASGTNSVAMGQQTTAQAYNSLVLGRYNVISGTTNSWVSTEPLFVLGNGGSLASRSNALTVLKNGNMGIGVADPDVELEVEGTIKISDMLTLTPQVAPPSAGSMGDVYMDTDGKLYVHDGSSWRALAFE